MNEVLIPMGVTNSTMQIWRLVPVTPRPTFPSKALLAVNMLNSGAWNEQ